MAKGSAFQKKLELSSELQEALGVKKASRGEVMKLLWKHIKKHSLNEGRTINPDKTLAPVLGKKSLDMFKMVKVVSKHIIQG